MKRKLKKAFLLMFLLIMISIPIYAKEIDAEVVGVEKSKAFEEWENLDEKDRTNSIEPSYYSVDIKDSIKRSVYNSLLDTNDTISKSYDLRNEINNIKVKNQKKVGACWAFSFTSMLETTLVHKYNITQREYSPMHIEYTCARLYNRILGGNGTRLMSLAYATGGYGPVYESDFSFESVYDEKNNDASQYYLTDLDNVNLEQKVRARVTDSIIFANISKKYDTNGEVTYNNSQDTSKTYSKEEVEVIRKLIKNQIKENGAVSAIFYSDIGVTSNRVYISANNYYNSQTKAFYCDNGTIQANHAVTIVGWDDTYSKENFPQNHQPINDGAYIVLNSWGEEFGENGYFYVSYDDSCIEREISAIKEIKTYNNEMNENVYQYDELGVSYGISLTGSNGKYLTSVEAANVFDRKDTSKKEYLTEVGIGLMSTEGIEVYVNSQDGDVKNANTLVATATGTNALESGYHSLKLANSIELTGEKFVIKVKYINEEFPIIPLEMNMEANGIITKTSSFYNSATSNKGESYILRKGTTWTDITDMSMGGKKIKNTNACIKGFSIVQDETPTINVEEIRVNKTNEEIFVGESFTLTATVLPENATNKDIKWVSSDEQIAIVENGVVKGIKAGIATIKAISSDENKIAECQVTVKKQEVNVTEIKIVPASGKIIEGGKLSLSAKILPENATNKNIKWSSSNINVATVKDGIVTAISAGTATITAISEDGTKYGTSEITVEKKEENPKVSVDSVKLTLQKTKIKIGDKTILQAVVEPENATNKKIKWISSNPEVATVKDGIVTAISAGTAQISVTTEDGNKTATCEVIVEKVINVSEIEISYNTKTINTGERFNLDAKITPQNATNKKIIWTSSNISVATVKNGEVIGVSNGTALITATTEDGNKTATCLVTVKNSNDVSVKGIELDKKEISMQINDQTNLVATIKPYNATNKEVKWESSDENIAVVSKDGIITAVSEGTATIKVTAIDGKYTETCKVTVNPKTNTADDIYKEQESGSEFIKNESGDSKDTTVSNKNIPYAGEAIRIIISIFIGAIIVGIILKRCIDLKDIK